MNSIKNWIGMFIHNAIAHPAMCFLPKTWGDRFHDWTLTQFWPLLENEGGA